MAVGSPDVNGPRRAALVAQGRFENMIRRLVVAMLATIALAGAAWAQDGYPSRAIRIIVPFAAGGGTDIIARIFGQALQERLAATVVIENIGGAGGSIGTGQAAKAA